MIVKELQSTIIDLKAKINELKHCIKNNFKQLWEWEKPEIERIIDETVDGCLNGAIIVIITKNLHLRFIDFT